MLPIITVTKNMLNWETKVLHLQKQVVLVLRKGTFLSALSYLSS